MPESNSPSSPISPTPTDGVSPRTGPPGRRRVVGDVSVQILGKGVLVLVSVAITVILVRSLGYRWYGQWATLLVILQITWNLGQLGLQQTTVRRITLEPADAPQYLGTALVIACAVALPVAALCAAISTVVATNITMLTAGLILSATVLGLAPSVVALIFQVRLRNDLTVLSSVVNTVMWSIFVIVVSAQRPSLVTYAGGYFAIWTLTAALQTALARCLSPIRFARVRELSRSMIRIGLPLGLTNVLVLSYSRIDQVFVFRLAGDKAASLYGAVYRILDQAQFVPLSIMTTIFPLLVAALHDEPRLRRMVRTTSAYLFLAGAPGLMVALVAGRPVVVFLFGRSFAPAAPALSLLMFTYVILCFGLLYTQLLVAHNRQAVCLKFALCGLVVNVILNLVTIPLFGFIGAAAVTVVTQGLVLGLSVWGNPRSARALPTRHVIWGCLGAAGLMGVTIRVLLTLGIPVSFVLLVATVVYVVALASFRVLKVSEVRSFIGGRSDPT
jgi:O-antigen/teichoic acid export membrane protein